MNIYDIGSVLEYGVSGKVVTRCMDHIGKAAYHLLNLMNQPLEGGGEVTDLDRRLAESGGYCASEVLRGIREDTGYGSLYLEQISMALDGGVGLSGGLCGALAGALLPMGLIWGIDPKREGFVGTLIPSLRGHVNLFVDSSEPELWAVTSEFMHEFSGRFGALECRSIVDRSFESGTELAEFMTASSTCAEIKEWCRGRAGELISVNTVFA
jgi:hypothetical protein